VRGRLAVASLRLARCSTTACVLARVPLGGTLVAMGGGGDHNGMFELIRSLGWGGAYRLAGRCWGTPFAGTAFFS